MGIVYVNLELTNLDTAQSALYMELVAHSLTTYFSPSLNTRVRAVVITTGPQIVHSKESNTLLRMMKLLRNPHHGLPVGIVIPGE